MKKRVSITDVAALADVSITTVSRVINDTGYPVSQEARDRILAAVEQLNYTPSFAAQRLRNDFNPVIGLIVRDIANSYFGEIAKGATERAMELGYLSFVCNTGRDAANEMEFHELLWKNRVRGILLIGGGIDTPEYQALMAKQAERCKKFGLRIVANAPQGVDLPIVAVDIAAISAQITGYLLERGHRSIALITGEQGVMTSKLHLQGYIKAMTAHGAPIHPELIKLEAFTERCGYTGCTELLRHNPRPTAICCGNDPIAVGVLHALHEAGLEVPRDVSLISIGDTPMAGHLRPALTSVRVPRYQLGARAVELILQDGLPSAYTEYLPTEFIERESVRRL
ncbi:MAG: LacI family DNA-binding transcriptional regulator [Treponemataceae bacterium]